MTLHHLLYRSELVLDGNRDEIAGHVLPIVEAAQARNSADGLTGALVFTEGTFVQVLEGSLDVLEATFERICRDLRHRRLQLLEFAVSDQRRFGDWSMANVTPTGDLRRLCSDLRAVSGTKLGTSTANKAVKLMQDALVCASKPPN